MRGARPPAVAGRFYPADPAELARQVAGLLGAVDAGADSPAEAYVVPHAGYRFSGPVAASVYARLGQARRVVLIGPAHFVPLAGCAVPSTEAFATPLGKVPVDVEGCRRLAGTGLAVTDDRPHEPEHSLEVQLPFLQTVLGDGWTVLPVAVGLATVDDVADVLDTATAEPALVLCSTDLSHHLPDPLARQRDRRTAAAVLDLDPTRIAPRDACGRHALAGLLGWARRRSLTPRLLDLRTSADTAGTPDRVVGYGAFALGRAYRR
ncbi:MAG TPA: AmmeMemoRadiSam system protein B [Actinophytocola sp.]|uniref:AmmeMemoRadiSam system protein B n=1 Tax=Actinophytocola sp. TaxID=1872138 RepID=UPI002DDD2F50|nr:AmmeMemoRadiSam system protein B [Actinophytocola sp.]HEV2783590.1 AmmeMemoRadiSam system protein B [Actinophytocola sp.]